MLSCVLHPLLSPTRTLDVKMESLQVSLGYRPKGSLLSPYRQCQHKQPSGSSQPKTTLKDSKSFGYLGDVCISQRGLECWNEMQELTRFSPVIACWPKWAHHCVPNVTSILHHLHQLHQHHISTITTTSTTPPPPANKQEKRAICMEHHLVGGVTNGVMLWHHHLTAHHYVR